ncbi:MAG: radical SAM protein [Saccharospirillaceae bacterium]|nr:viperin family antiviral radical SAM protein [Pseudomonadales bacterium]NRB81822.1 radical SAM protein [Saccharospirillaceae bacterium]
MSTQNNFVANTLNVTPPTLNNQLNELVINWHITEACNYNCTYCFAKWGKPNELLRSLEAIERLLDQLANYFIRGNPKIKDMLGYKTVRLNLAGGEPMMLGSTLSIVLILAKQKGFNTSIITNGSYLLKNKFDLPKNVLDMIGISFDSLDYQTRKEIGRIDRKGNSLSAEELKCALHKLSHTQIGLKTKINTVINAINWRENFSSFMSDLAPDKWKVLQVMPYGNDELLISDDKFNQFVERHEKQGITIYPESNSAMTESYLMIEPKGRFYQNSRDLGGYVYSDCINEVGANKALSLINFNANTFMSRYSRDESIIALGEVI